MTLRLRHSFIGWLLLAVPAAAQFVPINVDDPRPVEKILEEISSRCTCVITYEDPIYSSGQLIDMTKAVRKDGKSEPQVLGLPKRFMSFDYDPSDKVDRNIELALQQAAKVGLPFRLTQSREMRHVIPDVGSILSTPVTGILRRGTAFDVVRGILNAVSLKRGTRIGLFGMEQLLMHTSVTLPTGSGSADQLLLAVWPQISKEPRLGWKLLFEGQERFYVFNVVPIKMPQ